MATSAAAVRGPVTHRASVARPPPRTGQTAGAETGSNLKVHARHRIAVIGPGRGMSHRDRDCDSVTESGSDWTQARGSVSDFRVGSAKSEADSDFKALTVTRMWLARMANTFLEINPYQKIYACLFFNFHLKIVNGALQ